MTGRLWIAGAATARLFVERQQSRLFLFSGKERFQSKSTGWTAFSGSEPDT